ncbi:hypothetical protein HPP92_010153 [Vanilla planifolia]|uniref:Uncharacterized protein n=1 Tax=Vanilla planifolia TaxID=51239 RepID=A0A835R088_VANPL|nr:hypothetical protein HPP92_010153 [Vanilla planifolia]
MEKTERSLESYARWWKFVAGGAFGVKKIPKLECLDLKYQRVYKLSCLISVAEMVLRYNSGKRKWFDSVSILESDSDDGFRSVLEFPFKHCDCSSELPAVENYLKGDAIKAQKKTIFDGCNDDNIIGNQQRNEVPTRQIDEHKRKWKSILKEKRF